MRIRDRKGKGKIVIEYHTVDDYERVVESWRGRSSLPPSFQLLSSYRVLLGGRLFWRAEESTSIPG